jgi:glycosyltransferase involved in cell wall biosynthesis
MPVGGHPRVLLVSHTYLSSGYRGKLRWLATSGGVDLTLLAVPDLRLTTGTHLVFDPADEPFALRLDHPLAFANHNALRLYAPHRLAALLRAVRPDVVHVEAEPHSLSLAQMALLKARFGYQLVAFSWENLRRKGRGPLSFLEPFSLRRVDHMIAGNGEAAKVLRWRGYRGPITVLPQFGVDLEQVGSDSPLPELYRQAPAGMRIGFLGKLLQRKGVLDLLAAYMPLANRAVLVLLGDGPLESALQQQARENGVETRVLLPGYIPFAQVPAYLRGLDVLVLPSRTAPQWKEQFGHVLIEAMTAGVAVIGSDSGAIPEVIGPAGLVFAEGDVEALRGRLAFLLDHPEERLRLARAGQSRAAALFSNQAIAEATLRIYQQVLARD